MCLCILMHFNVKPCWDIVNGKKINSNNRKFAIWLALNLLQLEFYWIYVFIAASVHWTSIEFNFHRPITATAVRHSVWIQFNLHTSKGTFQYSNSVKLLRSFQISRNVWVYVCIILVLLLLLLCYLIIIFIVVVALLRFQNDITAETAKRT